ncbi:MAG: hypothetical protein KatS3mg115_1951 [Candidatus Poribacteria bacterium]|nr:MAG: hypothetical protein KatS3mg115_1951 [Candidatus Poribacteria bacterium]
MNKPSADRLPLSVAILCGGRSTRMGRPKALLPVAGERIIDRILRVAQAVSDDVFLVGDGTGGALESLEVPIVPDHWPALGPIGGVATALKVARHDLVACFASDMPFLSVRLVEMLYELLGDAKVVSVSGVRGWEPLCALYRKATLSTLEWMIRERELRLRILSMCEDVRIVEREELLSWGIDPRRAMNVNTPEMLHEAELIAPQLDSLLEI